MDTLTSISPTRVYIAMIIWLIPTLTGTWFTESLHLYALAVVGCVIIGFPIQAQAWTKVYQEVHRGRD